MTARAASSRRQVWRPRWQGGRFFLRCGALAAVATFLACAPIPPPDVLAQLSQVREVPASQEARQYAPQAFKHAEKLRTEASQAFEDGDFAGAQIIGERALAAYARASILARVVRAEQVRVTAQADAHAAQQALAEIDAEHQTVAADIAALQLRLKVLRSAEPIAASDPAKISREKARRKVVRSLFLQARLLCTAGKLLADSRASEPAFQSPGQLSGAQRDLGSLEGLLASDPAAAPIDRARRVRAACLGALTAVRRQGVSSAGATAGTDLLVSELSNAGYAAHREDHGVVVTLRGLFRGDALSTVGQRKIAKLKPILRQHPRFPMFIVMHQSKGLKPGEEPLWHRRGRSLAGGLGAPKAATKVVGNAQPVVDPNGKYSRRNERIDIVFVSPHTS